MYVGQFATHRAITGKSNSMKCNVAIAVLLIAVAFVRDVRAQSVTITDSPRPFSATAPAGWSRQPPATGNSRLKYVSPNGTPYAECAVIVKTIPAMRGHPQSEMDAAMLQAPDPSSIAQGLAGSYNNVRVISAGNAGLSGVPAQTYNVQYSVGSPAGEQWIRGVTTTALTVPDVSWTVACAGQGRTLAEAQKAFDYWQLEFVKFATYIKFVR